MNRRAHVTRGRRGSGPNLYEILQVHPRARPDQIRNAFRRVALRFHPDRNPSPEATSRFLKAVKAFKILSDPAKRAVYDRRLAGERKRRVGVPAPASASAAPATGPVAPAKVTKQVIDLVAVLLAISLPIFVGAAEAFGYRRWLYALVVLFVLTLIRLFRLR